MRKGRAAAEKSAEMKVILRRIRVAESMADIAVEPEPEEAALHLLLAFERHKAALRRIAASAPT